MLSRRMGVEVCLFAASLRWPLLTQCSDRNHFPSTSLSLATVGLTTSRPHHTHPLSVWSETSFHKIACPRGSGFHTPAMIASPALTVLQGLALVMLLLLPASAAERPLVGVNYFAGWWKGQGDKWLDPRNASVDWRPLYPQRVPLLPDGMYNTQPGMDEEIGAAADHGVDFFQILYYNRFPTPRAPNAALLNRGVTNFIHSSNASRMSFYISLCNSPPFAVEDDSQWQSIIEQDWLPALAHPSYLRIDGRLVLKFIDAPGFFQRDCNASRPCVDRRLDYLRSRVAAAGLGELLLGAGTPPNFYITNTTRDLGVADQYAWSGLYGIVPDLTPLQVYPWAALANASREVRLQHAAQPIPFLGHGMSGWDARPWGGEDRPVFAFPTDAEWRAYLAQLGADVQAHSLGFPRRNGSVQPAFNLYAWNEFGEGGILAPTRGWKYTRLQAIRDTFPRAQLENDIERIY